MKSKRVRHDVHAGQVWRDRDPRSFDGHRRVRVTKTIRESDGKRWVWYQQLLGAFDTLDSRTMRSRYERFQSAFELLPDGR